MSHGGSEKGTGTVEDIACEATLKQVCFEVLFVYCKRLINGRYRAGKLCTHILIKSTVRYCTGSWRIAGVELMWSWHVPRYLTAKKSEVCAYKPTNRLVTKSKHHRKDKQGATM